MTKTEDVWGGTVVEKQIHDSTAERLQRGHRTGGTSPADFKAEIAVAIEAVEQRLNNDFNAMIRLRAEIEATQAKTIAEQRVKAEVMKRVGRHIFEMQQGQRTIVTDGNKARFAEMRHNVTAEDKRRLEIGRLTLVVAIVNDSKEDLFAGILAASLARLPEVHKNISRTPRECLLAHVEACNQLNVLLAATAKAKIATLEAFNITNVRDRIVELKTALDGVGGEMSSEVIATIQSELATLRTPEAEDIAARRKREVTVERQFAESFARNFQTWAIAALDSLRAEAVEFERKMFADLHLPPEETVVSRRFKLAMAELRGLGTPEQVLRWFGMPSLTYVAEQLEQQSAK